MAIFCSVFFVLMLFALLAYGRVVRKRGYPASVVLKMICSSLFLTAGAAVALWKGFGQSTQKNLFLLLILSGMALGWVGDLLLALAAKKGERLFVAGIFLFAANHVCYLIALFRHTPFCWADLLLFLLLYAFTAGLGFGLLKWQVPKSLQIPGFFYFAVILLMVTKAFSFLFSGRGGAFDWVFAVGALLFFISDVVLVTNRFTQKERRFLDDINGFTYFYGQLIIACSLFFLP